MLHTPGTKPAPTFTVAACHNAKGCNVHSTMPKYLLPPAPLCKRAGVAKMVPMQKWNFLTQMSLATRCEHRCQRRMPLWCGRGLPT